MTLNYTTQEFGWTLIDTDNALGSYADTENLLIVAHRSTPVPEPPLHPVAMTVYLENGYPFQISPEFIAYPTNNLTFRFASITDHLRIARIRVHEDLTTFIDAYYSGPNLPLYKKNLSGLGNCVAYWSPARSDGLTRPAHGTRVKYLKDLSGFEGNQLSHWYFTDTQLVADTQSFGDGTVGVKTSSSGQYYSKDSDIGNEVISPPRLTEATAYAKAKVVDSKGDTQVIFIYGRTMVMVDPDGKYGISYYETLEGPAPTYTWSTETLDLAHPYTFSVVWKDNVATLRVYGGPLTAENNWGWHDEVVATVTSDWNDGGSPDHPRMLNAQSYLSNAWSPANSSTAVMCFGDFAFFSSAHSPTNWGIASITNIIHNQYPPSVQYDPNGIENTGDISFLPDGSSLTESRMTLANGDSFGGFAPIVSCYLGPTQGVNGWTLPIGFSVVSGELPPDAVLEPGSDTAGVYNQGNISGTATTSGTYTARIKADTAPGETSGYYTYFPYVPAYTDFTFTVGLGRTGPPAPPWPDDQGVAPKGYPPEYPGPGPEYPPPPGTDSHYPDLYYQYISMNQLVNYAIPFLPTLTDMIGPYRFSVVSGTFPQGLKFNVYTGGIYGRPNTVGEYSFRVRCSTGRGPVYSDVFISVWGAGDPPPGYSSMSYDILLLAVDTQYNDPFLPTLIDLTAPRTFSITDGTLPSGMVFNTSTGGVSGKPIVAGDFSLTVQCVAANDTVTCELNITTVFGGGVTPGPDDPWFEYLESGYAPQEGNISGISPVMHNVSGAQVFSIRAPSTRVAGDNFVVNASNGLFSGYSSVVLDQTYTIMCRTFSTDGHAVTIYAEVSVIVINNQDPPPRLKSITYDSPSFEVDVLVDPDTFFPEISEDLLGPFNFRVSTSALPTGLTLHSTTGMIDGTPTVVGDYDLVIKVLTPTDLVFSNNFTINIHAPEDPPVYNGVLVYNDISLLRGAFLDYHTNTKLLPAQIKSIDPPYTFSVTDGDLPEGIEFAADTGIFSGTPTTNGTSTITVEVTGLDGLRAGCTFKIIVYDTYVEPPHIPGGPEDTYWDEYAVDNVVDGDWATAPVLDIRPLTRVYLSYDAPVLAYGKPRSTRVIASSTDSGEIGTPTSADYGETDLLDVSDTNAPMWEWSANDLLDPYADNTADPTIFTTPPVAVSSWPTVDELGPEWIASGTNRPHASYFVSTSDMSQRVKRVLNFNTSDGAEHMTLDMGQDYNAMSVFIVAYVNNMGQSVHNIFDAGHVDPNDEVPCRASIAAYPDKLVVGTLPVDNMMQAGEKIVISQEYSHGWYQTKPVVFFATFADLVSSAGYYVPGKMSYRQSKLTSDTFRYLTLGRMYNSNSVITNAEMTVYGVFIVPDYLSKVSITKVCTNIASKYRLEEEWST